MPTPRRLLPSTASLRALEALERLGSATAAAEELSLTQSAVSRQIQTLEAQLGLSLVQREKRKMRLTTAGKAYAGEIRQALQQITNATLKLTTNPIGGSLNLAILPTFGMRWLVPRLANFAQRHPDIIINLSTRLKPFNFASQNFDAAIHFGNADWPGTAHLRLKTESVIPVCTPQLIAQYQPSAARDIAKMPLLHIETRPNAWKQWLISQEADQEPDQDTDRGSVLTGALYDQFSTITQAALHGLGVALLPDYLVEQDLAAKRLVIAANSRSQSLGAYYLVWPVEKSSDPSLRLFRDWLATQADDEDILPR
ncbi:MAG: LysR family transcriptional regulator [Rhodobacterales bacterium]|nr:LysR family transcriptional regulator [Rhodobacterales bacterium]